MNTRLPGSMILLCGLVSATAIGAGSQAGRTRPATQPPLPPISYVCPMPQDAAVLEDKPGNCPICKMQLVPVRLDAKFWCPTHQTLVVRNEQGKCPLDRKDLVPVTLSVFWTCADDPSKHLLEPGACANGQPRKVGYEARAHGDHNPRHGGQFFMAEDQWHHLEGTHPSPDLFRVFFYDNFTQPIDPKAFVGRVVRVQGDRDVDPVDLRPSRDGKTLEARLTTAGPPVQLAALIKFNKDTREQRFDFTFPTITVDQAPSTPAGTPSASTSAAASTPGGVTRTAPAAPQTGRGRATTEPAVKDASAAARAPVSAPTAASGTSAKQAGTPPASASQTAAPPAATPVVAPPTISPAPDTSTQPVSAPAPQEPSPGAGQPPVALAAALDESILPTTTPELLAELTSRTAEVAKLVEEGSLASVWLPAMGTKTVALALDSHARSMPERQRIQVTAAVRRVVTAAWQLDAYGDLGNKQKILEAYQRLASAVSDLKAAYAR
jgi:hypothetical protein